MHLNAAHDAINLSILVKPESNAVLPKSFFIPYFSAQEIKARHMHICQIFSQPNHIRELRMLPNPASCQRVHSGLTGRLRAHDLKRAWIQSSG